MTLALPDGGGMASTGLVPTQAIGHSDSRRWDAIVWLKNKPT
jgi:hypothetical protein